MINHITAKAGAAKVSSCPLFYCSSEPYTLRPGFIGFYTPMVFFCDGLG